MKVKVSSSRGRILVVDQEDWCREFLSAVIKLCGFEELKLATSVAEALEALAQSPFDLVITDLKLPDYRRLLDDGRSRYPTMRFILMVQQQKHAQQLLYLEYVDIVFKPLSLDEIVRKIRHAIHQTHLHQSEEELRRLKQEAFRIWG
ncbi:MAG: response regulator [Desulfobaccales bacterium]|nr:response regulator [Desulfobaccales bacterium]